MSASGYDADGILKGPEGVDMPVGIDIAQVRMWAGNERTPPIQVLLHLRKAVPSATLARNP